MVIIYSSSRIIIKAFLSSQEELFSSFFDDADVARYLPSYNKDEYKKLFEKIFEDYEKGPLGRWGVFHPNTDEYIGNCLIRIFQEDKNALEIGYSIGKKYWGKGLGSEIATAMVEYAFSKTEIMHLAAVTVPENVGSQKVLEKAGFAHDSSINRTGTDLYLYKLQRPV